MQKLIFFSIILLLIKLWTCSGYLFRSGTCLDKNLTSLWSVDNKPMYIAKNITVDVENGTKIECEIINANNYNLSTTSECFYLKFEADFNLDEIDESYVFDEEDEMREDL